LSTTGEKAAHWVLVKRRPNRRKSHGAERLGEEKIRTPSTVGNGTKIKGSACDAGLTRAGNLSCAWCFDEDKNQMHGSALLAHKESTGPWTDRKHGPWADRKQDPRLGIVTEKFYHEKSVKERILLRRTRPAVATKIHWRKISWPEKMKSKSGEETRVARRGARAGTVVRRCNQSADARLT
jgi:hypothetical protein